MGDLARYVPGSDLRPPYDRDLYGPGHPTEEENVYKIVTKEANIDGLGRVRHLIGQDADPETPEGVIAVFAKEIDGVIELCVRDEDNGPVLQLTRGGVLNAGPPAAITGCIPAWLNQGPEAAAAYVDKNLSGLSQEAKAAIKELAGAALRDRVDTLR